MQVLPAELTLHSLGINKQHENDHPGHIKTTIFSARRAMAMIPTRRRVLYTCLWKMLRKMLMPTKVVSPWLNISPPSSRCYIYSIRASTFPLSDLNCRYTLLNFQHFGSNDSSLFFETPCTHHQKFINRSQRKFVIKALGVEWINPPSSCRIIYFGIFCFFMPYCWVAKEADDGFWDRSLHTLYAKSVFRIQIITIRLYTIVQVPMMPSKSLLVVLASVIIISSRAEHEHSVPLSSLLIQWVIYKRLRINTQQGVSPQHQGQNPLTKKMDKVLCLTNNP